MLCGLLCFSNLSAVLLSTEDDFSGKIVSFFLVRDFEGAKESCETAIKIFPESHRLKALYIRALSDCGRCDQALEVFKKERAGKDLAENFDLLESLSWGILLQKEKESDMGVLSSLIGAYLTQDARAVGLLRDGLQSTNAFIRSVAVQFASNYNDLILQREIVRLFKEERNWFVKKELITAAGKMRLTQVLEELKEIVASRSVSGEEKGAAIQALVMMHDDITKKELQALVKSSRAGFRELAVSLIDHFGKSDEIDMVLPFLEDASPSVRIRILALLGSFNFDARVYASITKRLDELSKDMHPQVAMMADWVLLKVAPDKARESLKKWAGSKNIKSARFAASVIGAGGMATLPILEDAYNNADDTYVRATLAHSMLTQGVKVELAGKFLRSFLLETKEKIMVSDGVYPCFTMIMPSEVRHMPHMARYPEMVDQLSRLKLINTLSIVGVKDLKEIAKVYLQGQVWGVVGSAAVFFLEEGEMASIDLVRELLDDPDQTVRIQAALALAFYGGEKRAAKVLEEAYAKVDWDKKISILEALGHVGSRESIDFLLKVLEEPFTLPRTIAASSIIQCLYH